MTLEEFTSEQILKDVENLQYLFQLKSVIRYNEERNEQDGTESVTEHLYGINILTQYFLPLEDPEGRLDRAKIYELTTVHDFDEIVTGDFLSYRKDASHRTLSENGFEEVRKHFPGHLQEKFDALLNEYQLKKLLKLSL